MTGSQGRVSVVIPNYQGQNLLEKNLPKVMVASKNPKNDIVEIIVVDDGSIDGSVNMLKRQFPQIKLILHKKNKGFVCSVNDGVRAATRDFVCLLNTDVIPSFDFLEKVLPHFKRGEVFGVSLNEIGANWTWTKGIFQEGNIGYERGPKDDKVHETFWVSGGSGVFRKSLWTLLGGMDEKLFSPFYWEDLDLCYRATKRGYRVLWEPGAGVEHKHESTMSLLPQGYVARIKERNHLLFNWKNLTSPNLFRKHLGGLVGRVLKHPGYIRIVLMAVPKLGTVLARRRQEMKECKVSDESILARN